MYVIMTGRMQELYTLALQARLDHDAGVAATVLKCNIKTQASQVYLRGQ